MLTRDLPVHLTLTLACALAAASAPVHAADSTVVVMLIDGFAPAYIAEFDTPNFDRLMREGAWTHQMDPEFPTVSLINGVTISTGCRPENHGIVTNMFIDPERGLYDHSADADWLTDCEHMHQAAERQGVESAVLGWYGAQSSKRGAQASYVPSGEVAFGDFPDDAGRTSQLVEQLGRSPGDRPRLILAYLKGPDDAGHFKGMNAPETRAAVESADTQVGRVLAAIDAQPDRDDIHLLITTDHGMVPVEQVVNISRILRRHDIRARPVSTGTASFLYFDRSDDAWQANVDEALGKLSSYEQFDVVRSDLQPSGWHIGSGPRVGDVIVSAHPPYFIEDISAFPWFLRWLEYVGPDFLASTAWLKATHGYPTGTPGIEGILYTRGSAFARGREVESVRAIDIHPTVLHVLGIEPGQPVDGVVATQLLH
ncbi:MAG: nucleotide pyrophosphatase/phosphodiesterase family protein [Myxococcota bacterium]